MRDRIGVHSGQHAPRKIRHDKRSIDLNTASRKELANLPMVGRDRALSIIPNRPFRGWDNVGQRRAHLRLREGNDLLSEERRRPGRRGRIVDPTECGKGGAAVLGIARLLISPAVVDQTRRPWEHVGLRKASAIGSTPSHLDRRQVDAV